LGEFVRAYVLGLGAVLVAATLSPFLVGISVGVVGIFMTRYISRRVIWWNQANNLENVYRTKIHMLVTWPVSVPVLIFQIFVVQNL
jgi:hypothetical protein